MDTPKSEFEPDGPRAYHGTAGPVGVGPMGQIVPLDQHVQRFFASSQAELRHVRLLALDLAIKARHQEVTDPRKYLEMADLVADARKIIEFVEEV